MGSSRDDDASNQDIVGIGDFFAPALHVLDTEVNGFTDVGEGLGHSLALRVATRNGRTNYDIAAVALVGFEKHFEVFSRARSAANRHDM